MPDLLRHLGPQVLGVLVRRGADFATAEDAVQEALIAAVETWPERRPDDPKGWLVRVAWRRYLDACRSDTARRRREQADLEQPPPGPTEQCFQPPNGWRCTIAPVVWRFTYALPTSTRSVQ